jgi:hypoxanthine phosphoribosyltransferase
MDDAIGEILIQPAAIKQRVAELGEQISADYGDTEILMVGVLKGAILFMVDLARVITSPLVMDFMAVSSYGAATVSSGIVRILKDLEESVEGRHVLLCEDVIDSGLTLNYLRNHLSSQNPASLKVVTLLNKDRVRHTPAPVDYVGFTIPDVFVVGYGLDVDERYRNLPYIARYIGPR